jgi:hypothetical protein
MKIAFSIVLLFIYILEGRAWFSLHVPQDYHSLTGLRNEGRSPKTEVNLRLFLCVQSFCVHVVSIITIIKLLLVHSYCHYYYTLGTQRNKSQ